MSARQKQSIGAPVFVRYAASTAFPTRRCMFLPALQHWSSSLMNARGSTSTVARTPGVMPLVRSLPRRWRSGRPSGLPQRMVGGLTGLYRASPRGSKGGMEKSTTTSRNSCPATAALGLTYVVQKTTQAARVRPAILQWRTSNMSSSTALDSRWKEKSFTAQQTGHWSPRRLLDSCSKTRETGKQRPPSLAHIFWLYKLSPSSKWQAQWTHRLIPNIIPWIERRHGEVNYHLTQLLIGHGCFRSYLYRTNNDTSDPCLACLLVVEDAEHVIFHCPRFAEEEGRFTASLEGPWSLRRS
ncbi:unnamed protein product [Trichogramma brassicae]|uniref:Reverse transcriptase zinc-binding domain-containing protein n=1 Tax=Trichogramma brassicae TaxID=86971 RepID=A0A6H5IRX3_9HYME|nr:unnamed protein product [Trichogramma brassicae]